MYGCEHSSGCALMALRTQHTIVFGLCNSVRLETAQITLSGISRIYMVRRTIFHVTSGNCFDALGAINRDDHCT